MFTAMVHMARAEFEMKFVNLKVHVPSFSIGLMKFKKYWNILHTMIFASF